MHVVGHVRKEGRAKERKEGDDGKEKGRKNERKEGSLLSAWRGNL
jgi:hypothetical protein